jgi:hypothetical protein
MYLKNILIGLIAVIVSLAGIALVVLQDIGLPPNSSIIERMKRALLGGIGLMIFCIGGLSAISSFGFPNSDKGWNLQSLEALFRFMLPLVFLCTIGLFIRYSTSDAIHVYFSRKMDEIKQNSKRQKKELRDNRCMS